MAAFLLITAILGVSSVHAVTVTANEKNSASAFVRREQKDATATMQMHASGNMQWQEGSGFDEDEKLEGPEAAAVLQEQEARRAREDEEARVFEQEITACNRQYILMEEGTDACTGAGKPHGVRKADDCKIAAKQLNLKVAEKPNFELNTHAMAILPYPHGCYLNTSTNLVAWNPTESNSTTIEGRKICMRTKYMNATVDSKAQEGCDAVGGQPILDSAACWAAALCAAGGGACKQIEFAENMTWVGHEDKPKGCFQDSIGCWGYNYINTTPSKPIFNGTPVCLNVVPEAGAAASATMF